MFIRKIINKFTKKISELTQGKKEKAPIVASASRSETVDVSGSPQIVRKTRKRRPPKRVQDKTLVSEHEPILWDESQFQVPVQEGKTRFHDLSLPNEIIHAIADTGFQYCTPIQAEMLSSTITGSDATGRAQTGTGKTAAFLITILTTILSKAPPQGRKNGEPRALILAPTRELVMQIVEDAKILAKYASVEVVAVFGGVDYAKQQKQLSGQKVDIVVATPGRLMDFQRQNIINLGRVEILVIDEADRMLNMGFIPDVRRIVYSTPDKERRQTLLFSATLTPEVIQLSSQWTKNPIVVEIEPDQVVTDTVNQLVYLVTGKNKFALLYNIIQGQKLERVIVFCNRKDQTKTLSDKLTRYGIDCAILSGDVPQHKRAKTLDNFRNGKIRVLVATDVAGRGIHIEKISHVINYTLPFEAEDYVHRIGRTGRAGLSGTSVSFADESDSFYLPDIEEFIGEKLHCIQPEDDWLILPPPVIKAPPKKEYDRNKRPVRPRREKRSFG
ncbi:MAG: DEAD/DEAH box helicase [Proteobacteria bacterium]|nr:DEAD/DEAH box helicase [Pseudomonadota bacterium]MBU1710176.1 DEAD/DEAH box helicase [Pseudomonadota bacterium]